MVDPGLDAAVQARSLRADVPALLPYIVACAVASSCSGGLLNGMGPFTSRLMSEGYITPDQVSIVYTGAFQIMTWGSLLAVHAESRWGPRLSAATGACIQMLGHLHLSQLNAPADPHAVMVAYGLVGWGGNHMFFSTFQFAQLFPNHVGLADGVLAGLFGLAGCVFLGFNFSFVTVRLMFSAMLCVASIALAAILVLWPDIGYARGDKVLIVPPTFRHARNIFHFRTYTRSWRCLATPRYVLYALTFAWSTLVSCYVAGHLVVYQTTHCVGDNYMQWFYPLIANPTFLTSWSVGYTIDHYGFAAVSFVLIACCLLSLGLLSATEMRAAAWSNLFLLHGMTSIQYTIEFVFLHKAIPESAYPAALSTALVTQGMLGFVANPGLSPNPWGKDYRPPAVLLSLPGVLLLAWPIFEWRWRRARQQSRQHGQGATALLGAAPAVCSERRGVDGLAPPPLESSPVVAAAGSHVTVLASFEIPTEEAASG